MTILILLWYTSVSACEYVCYRNNSPVSSFKNQNISMPLIEIGAAVYREIITGKQTVHC